MAQAVIIGASIASSAVSAIGQLKQGDAAKKAGDMNAANARQNASDAIEQARLNEVQQRKDSYKVISSARADYGASGATLEGSPMDVLEQSSRNAELDALTIRYGGQVRANAYERDAKISEMEGNAARSTSRLAAAGTFLSGVTGGISKGLKLG
jgi:DNA repair ATPase RecN